MAWSVMDSDFGQSMAEDMREGMGLRMPGVAANGVRNFASPIRSIAGPGDMEGL